MDAQASIMRGQFAMVTCGVTYLAWWAVFFWPDAIFPLVAQVLGFFSIIVAMGSGSAAAYWMASGAAGLLAERRVSHGRVIALVTGVAFVALFAVTVVFWQRPPTVELVLILGWTALESYAIDSLRAARAFGAGRTALSIVLITATVAVCLVCYTVYYSLPAWESFVCGCIPLAVVAACSGVLGVLAAIRER